MLFISLRLIFLKLENMSLYFCLDVYYTTHLLAAEECDDGDEVAWDAYKHEENAAGGSEAEEGSRVALEQLEVEVVQLGGVGQVERAVVRGRHWGVVRQRGGQVVTNFQLVFLHYRVKLTGYFIVFRIFYRKTAPGNKTSVFALIAE